MKTRKIFTLLIFLGLGFGLSSGEQVIQYGWLMPDFAKNDLPRKSITYLPKDGLNLYDRPNGEYIARLNRDTRSRDYPGYLRNVFLSPRNRTPELLVQEAFKPLLDDCYAIPFVKQSDGYLLLFDTLGPDHYWASIREIESQNFYLTDQESSERVINIAPHGSAGLLIPDFEKLPELPRERFAYAPAASGWTVYQSPEGKPRGRLSRFCPTARYEDGNMRMFLLPNRNPNECGHITTENLHHLSDDTYVIPFFEKHGDFIRLFDAAKFSDVWVKIDEVATQNFQMVDWISYFVERRYSPAHANGGLNLREGPYADAPVILTVRGEEMDIFLIGYDDGFCEGQWCKVKVIVHKENPCTTTIPEAQNRIKECEGWIKLIDDSGLPNIYINTKGC